MPFHKRAVVPQRLCRLNKERCIYGVGQSHFGSGKVDDGRVLNSKLWTCLNDISSDAMTNILHQLSDLSRHACSIFLEIQNEATLVIHRATVLQQRLDSLQSTVRKLDHKKITLQQSQRRLVPWSGLGAATMVFISATLKSVIKYFKKKAVSGLDEESKWSVHYTAPWREQENIFLPGSRPPCVEELHHQAKVNLKSVLRECDKLRKDGFRSSQYYSQGPRFSSPVPSSGPLDQDEAEKKKSPESSADDETLLLYPMTPQTPLLNSVWDVSTERVWSRSLPLPTPEEKMRQHAQSVASHVIPINITGESFDRQASFRRTLINTDTLVRRSKKVKRRKTITGVPDNIQRELATKGETELRIQSMYMVGQYSTLGHVWSANSTLKHSDTRDSGCQTDEVRIIQPSMRRIRAQRGHGIAAQMANVSPSSSSSISNMSDCDGSLLTPQCKSSELGFHSLPRHGASVSPQQHEPKYSGSSCKMSNGSTNSLPFLPNRQHASPATQHMLFNSIENTLFNPKSPEFQGFHRHDKTGDHMVADRISSPASFSPSDDLQNPSDFSSIHYPLQGFGTEEASLRLGSSCPSDHSFSTAGTSLSADSSRCHSPASLHTTTHTESQCSTLDGRNCNSPSGASESSTQSCSTLTTDQWTYESHPKGPHASNCSSPSSHVYNSLERSPSKTDSSSLFSVDTEGYYTSMHQDSGLKSLSHDCINKSGHSKRDSYECTEHHSQCDHARRHSKRPLTRSVSLRKAKKPPLPPKRTDSLRRKPHPNPQHDKTTLNDQLISSLQESRENHSAAYGQMLSSGLEALLVSRSRSQSTVSTASSRMSAPAAVCPVTPTHSDGGSQRSELAESWDFCMDFPRSRSEQGPSSQVVRSVNAGESAEGLANASDQNGFLSAYCSSTRVQLKMAISPDKVPQMASPSSGYSSQSITPTGGTPVTSLLRAKSPAGRPKPKVPERKSSLRSSSSSTSLCSNTSDSIRNLPTPPPLPTTMPGLFESISVTPVSSSVTALKPPLNPPPPPLLAVSSTPENKQSATPLIPPTPEKGNISLSSILPNQPSPLSDPLLMSGNATCPVSPTAPPPLPLPCVPTPSITGTNIQDVAPAKTANPLLSVESIEGEKFQRPQITAQALQMVKLRPIKLMKLESVFSDIITTVCNHVDQQQRQDSRRNLDNPAETEVLENISTFNYASELENTSAFPVEESSGTPNMLSPHQPSVSGESVSNNQSDENIPELSIDSEPSSSTLAFNSPLQSSTSQVAHQSTPQKQKLPISPNKSNLSLIIPPILHQSVLNGLESHEVTSPEVPSELEALNSLSLTDCINMQETPLQVQTESESDSGNSTPMCPSSHSLSSEFSSDSLNDLQLTALVLSEHNMRLSDDLGLSDDRGISDDGSSSTSGSIIFKDEENGAVFDSSTYSSSPTSSPNGVAVEEMETPVRLRTTEDLFAAIHRSKRKVLGRGESEEERPRGSLPSPPATTGPWPGLPPISRQRGSAQRSVRRSPTSNDGFKALLLKKGSRSDPGSRMSAADMLKLTDPRLHRAAVEATPPDESCASPGRSRKAYEEWARTEGALPRLSPSLTPSKYGRSSTPPSAASSRYNSRSRVPSGPMTMICEREGELAESAEGILTVEIPFPMSLSSGVTVCAQGST